MGTIHEVQDGEYLLSIAKQYGFRDWHIIWDDPNNADFRKRRKNPNVIYVGDQIYIPDKEEKDQSGGTGKRHSFKLAPREKPTLKVKFRDTENRPFKDEPYELSFMNGDDKDDPISGTTDGDGILSHEIPPDRDAAEVWFTRQKLRWHLDIADLDPALQEDSGEAVIRGVQQRLGSLGFPCGSVDGIFGP